MNPCPLATLFYFNVVSLARITVPSDSGIFYRARSDKTLTKCFYRVRSAQILHDKKFLLSQLIQ